MICRASLASSRVVMSCLGIRQAVRIAESRARSGPNSRAPSGSSSRRISPRCRRCLSASTMQASFTPDWMTTLMEQVRPPTPCCGSVRTCWTCARGAPPLGAQAFLADDELVGRFSACPCLISFSNHFPWSSAWRGWRAEPAYRRSSRNSTAAAFRHRSGSRVGGGPSGKPSSFLVLFASRWPAPLGFSFLLGGWWRRRPRRVAQAQGRGEHPICRTPERLSGHRTAGSRPAAPARRWVGRFGMGAIRHYAVTGRILCWGFDRIFFFGRKIGFHPRIQVRGGLSPEIAPIEPGGIFGRKSLASAVLRKQSTNSIGKGNPRESRTEWARPDPP